MATATTAGTSTRGRTQKEGVRGFVDLWVRLFREHDLGTLASAIAFKTVVGTIAFLLLGLGLLGVFGRHDVWTEQLSPHIQGRVLPDVFKGIDQTVERIFTRSSYGLVAFAAL